jgi:hypothetical protein
LTDFAEIAGSSCMPSFLSFLEELDNAGEKNLGVD